MNTKICATCKHCLTYIPDTEKGGPWLKDITDKPESWLCDLEVMTNVVTGATKKVTCYEKRLITYVPDLPEWLNDCGIEGNQWEMKNPPF